MGTDDAGIYDPYRNAPAPDETYLDKQMYTDILSDLKQYVKRHASGFGYRGTLVPEVFDRWLSLADEKGADRIVFLKDIAEPLMADIRSRGEEATKTTVQAAWPIIKKLVAHFFEDELDSRISDKMKERLHLSSQDVISYDIFRVKLARWVLSV